LVRRSSRSPKVLKDSIEKMGFAVQDLLGKTMQDENQIEGFWGNKTSSVNFCEADYIYSTYIAEFHNSWTSLIFVWLPLVGLLYANPTKEWRFVWAYTQLIITGIGSIILHLTLTSAGQKADEIPMLWMCSAIFYNVRLKCKQKCRAIEMRMRCIACIEALTVLLLLLLSSSFASVRPC